MEDKGGEPGTIDNPLVAQDPLPCPVINGEAPDWMKEGYASEMDRNLAHASMGAGGGATGFNFTPNDRRNWYKGNDPYNGTFWGTQLNTNQFYSKNELASTSVTTRSPDFYVLNVTIAIPNKLTGTLIGWSGSVSMDKHGQVFISPIGVSVGKSAYLASISLTANWLLQKKAPSATETYSFLSGHGVSAGAGFYGGINWSISPANKGTQNALGIGFLTPQIGASYNYTSDDFIFNKK